MLLRKVDIRDIFIQHFRTLQDVQTKKALYGDYLLFYAVPVLPVVLMYGFKVDLSNVTLGVLATALSILAGLLFNLLVLLHTLSREPRGDPHDTNVKNLLKQTHANVAYAIIVSLCALVPLVIAANYPERHPIRLAVGTVGMYLVLHFTLTMGMVLKRTDALLHERMDD